MVTKQLSQLPYINARYQPIKLIGRGGMGVVYRVYDSLTQQPVALKMVSESVRRTMFDTLDSSNVSLSLVREFQTLASLRHPHIISVLDYGFTRDNQAYFTMELLEDGQTILESGKNLAISEKVKLLVQSLRALLYLHRRGVLHRDLKPGNMLVKKGNVKLLDFGLAVEERVASDIIQGTLAYSAPEVLGGKAPTEASDLYAIGVIAYELITGLYPYPSQTVTKLIYDIVNTEPDWSLLNSGQLANAESLSDLSLETLPLNLFDNDTIILEKTFASYSSNAEPSPSEAISLPSIIRRLLSKHPQGRYAEAGEVIRDLSIAIAEPLEIETAATRESFLQAARFVGREPELKRLLVGLEKILNRQGGVWLVTGESGIGKSRLIEELRIRALTRGALVVRGQANSRGVPYQMWREPLRRLVLEVELEDADASVLQTIIPDISRLVRRYVHELPSLEPDERQKQLMTTIANLLRRQKQPIVLILEDLHEAYSESLALLEQLIPVLSDLPVMILGSYRNDELTKITVPGETIMLSRFNTENTLELSVAMLGIVGRQKTVQDLLLRETEGNVFFLVETVRALAESAGQLDQIGGHLSDGILTGGIQQIVQKRIDRVTAADLPLLQVAAVIGREIDVKVLPFVNPKIDLQAWLFRCAEVGVLEVQEDKWRFSHQKLREQVIANCSSAELIPVHRQAAEALEAAYHDHLNEQTASLTYHWKMADQPQKELHYAILAGDQSYLVSANQEAITHFSRALELMNAQNTANLQKVELKNKIAKAQLRLGQITEAQTLLQENLKAARDFGDERIVGDVLSILGSVYQQQGAYEDAIQHFKESLIRFRKTNAERGLADVLLNLGRIAANQGNFAEATQHIEQIVPIYQKFNDQWGVANTLNILGSIAAAQGDLKTAEKNFHDSLATYRSIGNREGMAGVLLNLGILFAQQSDHAEAKQYFEESLSNFREIGYPWGIGTCLLNLGMSALHQQKYQDAETRLNDSLKIFREINDQFCIANALVNLGHVDSNREQYERALSYFREALVISQQIGALPVTLEGLAGVGKIKAKTFDRHLFSEIVNVTWYFRFVNPDAFSLIQPLIDVQQFISSGNEVDESLEKRMFDQLEAVIDNFLLNKS